MLDSWHNHIAEANGSALLGEKVDVYRQGEDTLFIVTRKDAFGKLMESTRIRIRNVADRNPESALQFGVEHIIRGSQRYRTELNSYSIPLELVELFIESCRERSTDPKPTTQVMVSIEDYRILREAAQEHLSECEMDDEHNDDSIRELQAVLSKPFEWIDEDGVERSTVSQLLTL